MRLANRVVLDLISMDHEERQHSDASVATPTEPINTGSNTAATSVASDAKVTALDDGLKYTLTALEAIERFASARRRSPSLRSIQRYCDEGTIRGTKIRTTFGQEWLINEDSLMTYIGSLPIEAVVASVASDANQNPIEHEPLNTAPATTNISDASVAKVTGVATPVGETRSLAQVLIENAKLLAQNEGKDAVIIELKEDRSFLREEVVEARKARGDIKEIAKEMLGTLKAIALPRSIPPPTDAHPMQAEIITTTGESRPA
ncbi:MAG: hypothetical protein ACKVP7_18605 [Hyphomicrobiaceae bacterium]